MDWSAKETIAAIATAQGEGAVAIVRLSGSGALNAGRALFKFAHPPASIESHRLYFGSIQSPNQQELIDQGLFVFMRAPHSFTGEDSVELQLHGGKQSPQRTLKAALSLPQIRQAEPGEFSFRAFLNQKLSLSQAEAIHELVRAQSALSHKLALNRLSNNWQGEIDAMHMKLVEILSELEAEIDFPELLEATIAPSKRMDILKELQQMLKSWAQASRWQRPRADRYQVCIAGAANVGKSTLFNALLREERALVAASPGTTRDYIDADLEIGELSVRLIDTAGFRDVIDGEVDELEEAGMKRSRDQLAEADLIFWVDDRQSEISTSVSFPKKARVINIINKIDMLSHKQLKEIKLRLPDSLYCSAKMAIGIIEIKQALEQECRQFIHEVQSRGFCVNDREGRALNKSEVHLSRALALSDTQPELIAQELWGAAQALEELSGRNLAPDVVEAVFKNFCIGK